MKIDELVADVLSGREPELLGWVGIMAAFPSRKEPCALCKRPRMPVRYRDVPVAD